jgi:hypothetical protein
MRKVLLLKSKTNRVPIFMHQMHISTTLVYVVVLRPKKFEIQKKWENFKSRKKMLYHEIEPKSCKVTAMQDGDNPLFWNEFIKFTVFLYSFVHVCIFKQVPTYLATGLQRPSGTYSPPAEASTQGFKSKTNVIPILMNQILLKIIRSFYNLHVVWHISRHNMCNVIFHKTPWGSGLE